MKAVEISRPSVNRLESTARTVEVINAGALLKDACCNLSESFTSSASVDVSYSDAVSGAKEIRLLGLDGAYSQMMIENIPALRGLSNTLGMAYLPGPWMSSIQVNKGAGSVVNGWESMTGQINIEIKKPQSAERFFANVFLNNDLRTEVNLHTAHPLHNPHWHHATFAHVQLNEIKMDINRDGFMDNPLVTEGNVMSRWTYLSGQKFNFIGAISAVAEDRRGGQIHYDFAAPITQAGWGLRLRTVHPEFFAKTGIVLNETSSLGLQYKYYYHLQDGFVGRRNYRGEEHFGYLNLIYQHAYTPDNEENLIKVGASIQGGTLHESFDTIHYRRAEYVPGAFAEWSYAYQRKLSLIAGLRADYHSLYGPLLSPRFNFKWNILYSLSLRLSAGRGYHIATPFAENYGLLSNNRNISLPADIRPEVSWNYGGSLLYTFYLGFREGAIGLDFYRTDFQNQLIVDIENPRNLSMYNLHGQSYSNSLQIEATYELVKRLTLKLAYKWDDVHATYTDTLRTVPMKPRHKGLMTVEYKTKKEHWRFNTSLTWYGQSRIPSTLANSIENQRPLVSKDYLLWNAQITYTIRKKWDIYIGAENILNQIQDRAIIAPDAPHSNQFDASLVWGQLRGAMVFAGFRVSIKREDEKLSHHIHRRR